MLGEHGVCRTPAPRPATWGLLFSRVIDGDTASLDSLPQVGEPVWGQGGIQTQAAWLQGVSASSACWAALLSLVACEPQPESSRVKSCCFRPAGSIRQVSSPSGLQLPAYHLACRTVFRIKFSACSTGWQTRATRRVSAAHLRGHVSSLSPRGGASSGDETVAGALSMLAPQTCGAQSAHVPLYPPALAFRPCHPEGHAESEGHSWQEVCPHSGPIPSTE